MSVIFPIDEGNPVGGRMRSAMQALRQHRPSTDAEVKRELDEAVVAERRKARTAVVRWGASGLIAALGCAAALILSDNSFVRMLGVFSAAAAACSFGYALVNLQTVTADHWELKRREAEDRGTEAQDSTGTVICELYEEIERSDAGMVKALIGEWLTEPGMKLRARDIDVVRRYLTAYQAYQRAQGVITGFRSAHRV